MATSEEASKCIQHLHRTELHGKMISVERTRHEPGGALKRTEAARRLAEKRANAAKAAEAKKAEKVAEKPEEKKKPDAKVEAKESEVTEGEGEAKGKSQEPTEDAAAKEHSKTRSKSKERPKRPHSRSHSRERRSIPFRFRRFDPRSKVRGLVRPRMLDRFHKPFFPRRPLPFLAKPGFKPVRSNLLTFQKIKRTFTPFQEERLRERQRLRQREIREEERRRFQEMRRHKEIERKQREEAFRLERERERLRMEREKLEREKAEVLRLEREKARLERERLEREREELRRREHISRIEEPRRSGTKRPYEARSVREPDPYWEERKRPSNRYTNSPPYRTDGSNAKYHDFEHRERSFDRPDSFDRRTERVERENDVRREGRREAPAHEREERRVERFDRTVPSSREVRGRERDSSRGMAPRDRGPPRDSASMRRPPPPRDDWKGSQHDRRVHDHPRDRPDRYIDSKGMSGPSGGSFGGSRSYGSDRESWSSGQHERGMGRSVGSGIMGSSSQYMSSDRKMDSHGQSWGRGMDGSQGDRWAQGMGSSMDSRRGQQGMGLGPQGVISQPGQSGIFGSSVPSMVTQSNMGGGGFGGDRYIHTVRRY